MTTKEQRAKFEAAFLEEFPHESLSQRKHDGAYEDAKAIGAWWAWQVAIASQQGQDAKDAARYRHARDKLTAGEISTAFDGSVDTDK